MKSQLRASPLGLRNHQERAGIVSLVERAHAGDAREDFVEQLDPLGPEFVRHEEARNQPLGDGIGTDILGAMGEGLDSLFITGGLAAEETGTSPAGGPDPALLAKFLDAAMMSPRMAMAFLR